MSKATSRAPLRVAIVGLGPKGLYAFERLVAHAREALPPGSISVDLYEPHPVPGAGPVYEPGQPRYLRMNFAADMVDMWPERGPDPARPSFSEWRAAIDGAGAEAYPPRALVGRYLAEGFERVMADAGGSVAVELHPESVTALDQTASSWLLSASENREYDEVLVSTGHVQRWEGALESSSPMAGDLVPSVFPVERWLSPQRVPAGSVVAIRGFALTMIDAALALTEGRGGSFAEGAAPYLLRYEPGEGEVSAILPYSRTGRPMLAKPDPAHTIRSDALERIATEGRSRVASLSEGAPLADAVAAVGDVAVKSLRDVTAKDEGAQIGQWLKDAMRGQVKPSHLSPAQEIERSLAVGAGAAEPGPDWALGHAWRAVYPPLVDRLGGRGIEDREWPAFRRLAAEMERVSFGPPPVNAAKLLALIEHGKVDCSTLTSGRAPGAHVVIDAVLPPPGTFGLRQPLLEQLLRDGHARVPSGRRGLELTADIECVSTDGEPSHGLGAIGRPTEDWVIGNDTLNRALHPQPDLWARRVVVRAAR